MTTVNSVQPIDYDSKTVRDYFTRALNFVIESMLHDGKSKVQYSGKYLSMTYPNIIFHVYYVKKTNKLYIEYGYSTDFVNYINRTIFKERLEGFLQTNMRYDIRYIPEILLYEDSRITCDSNEILTPYTIGYWKSLSGRYQFIEDSTIIQKDSRKFKYATRSKEYTDKKNQIFNTYHNDPETMWAEMTKLDYQYKISPDDKPEKSISEFIDITNDIKNKYIGVEHVNDKVPEIYNEFKTAYKNFFGESLIGNAEGETFNYRLII